MSRCGTPTFSWPSSLLSPADSDKIQVEWWAIPATGSPFVLHEVTDFDIADIFGARGAISLTTPAGTALHTILLTHTLLADRDLEVEIRLFGGAAQSLRGFLSASDADEVAEDGTRKFSGTLVAQRMYEAVLFPDATNEKGETKFRQATAGAIIQTLMNRARGRGSLTDITSTTFSTTKDSLGNTWPLNTTITFSPGATYGELLEELTELGMCEWEVTGLRELKLYVPGARGFDHTTSSPIVVLHRGRDLTEAPRTHSVRDSVTTMLVAGKEGIYETVADGSALARRGRRIETFESNGQLESPATVQAYGQNKLTTMTAGVMELTHGLVVNSAGPQPFLNINVGDLLWSDTGSVGGTQKLRVQQVTLSRSGDEYTAIAVVGTLTQSAIVRLNQKLARLARGSAVVGTSTADPASSGEDVTPPAAPVGLVADSIAYQDAADGMTLASVTVGWEAVTTNAGGASTPQAKAAQLIRDRIRSGAGFYEDWTWDGAPELVGKYNDALLALFEEEEPSGGTTTGDFGEGWLNTYYNDNSESATATDDVAGYRVRYAYVGLNQVGGIPSSDPFSDDKINYYMATDNTGTPNTSFTFGGVGAGADIRVQVLAFDRSGNESEWSLPLTFTTEVDNVPPPVTSRPTGEDWLGTVKVKWDGLGSVGEAMPMDFSHVEVHVDPALDFTPTDLTYQTNMYAAGTWNVVDRAYGVAQFARLVSVDRAGNKSEPSLSSEPIVPRQLVDQDLIDGILTADKIADFAVNSAKIVDGAIINAKIADLAVNDAKVMNLSVGKITAGTLFADVTLSGVIRTALTGPRAEMDAAGIRLYNSLNTNTVRLSAMDGSALITGTYQSGLTGERINMLPDGTLRFYPQAGNNYSQIANFGNDVVWRGPLDPNGRSGRLNVNVLGVGMNYSAESEIPSNLRAEIVVFDRRARITSPTINFECNGKLSTTDGGPRRIMFSTTNSSGSAIGTSFVTYQMADSGSGGFYGNGGGIKFEAGQALITTGGLEQFGTCRAAAFSVASSRTVKHDIEKMVDSTGVSAADIVQAIPASTFVYDGDASDTVHVGLIVEDVEPIAPELVIGLDALPKDKALSTMGVATVAWEAAAEAHREIAALRAELAELKGPHG